MTMKRGIPSLRAPLALLAQPGYDVKKVRKVPQRRPARDAHPAAP